MHGCCGIGRGKEVLRNVIDDRQPGATDRAAELGVGGPVFGAADQNDRYICVTQGPAEHRLIFARFYPPRLHHKRFAYTCVLAKGFWVGIQKQGWVDAVVGNLKAVAIPLQIAAQGLQFQPAVGQQAICLSQQLTQTLAVQ